MITVNETGYLPEAAKIAAADRGTGFRIKDVTSGDYMQTEVRERRRCFDGSAGEEVIQLDFSDLRDPGLYVIEDAGGSRSCSFKIEPHVYRSLKNATVKALYFQRCGMELKAEYAGPYVHAACHCGSTKYYNDDSQIFDITGGWHDAGDFGRYATPAAVALAHLLYAYELFPQGFSEQINIPESGNGLPDVLNECRYELDWLIQQQAADGGVYHKQTTMHHAEFMMPEKDDAQLCMFPVSSMATADFAAVMCLASRVYEKADPLFARDAVHAAVMAGMWLIKHPENTDFHNPEGCNTGEYNDDDDTDERLWAFAELIRTDYEIKNESDHSMMAGMPQKMSRQKQYMKQAEELFEKYSKKQKHADNRYEDDGFGWLDVSGLAAAATVFDERNIAGEEFRAKMYGLLVSRADIFLRLQSESGFAVAMKPVDFVWGSNMVVANRGMLFICACLAVRARLAEDEAAASADVTSNVKVIEYSVHDNKEPQHLSADERQLLEEKAADYEKAALEQLHYICGRNAMDVSYVTGFGEHAFMHPHNRTCVSDGIERPIPGEVSGGPCCPPVDERAKELVPEGTAPMKCYADDDMCYSLNEIAIYWNTPVSFLAAYFDR